MRISSVNKASRNEYSYTMLVEINVNWNNLSRKYKYATGVLKLLILCDPVIIFLEILNVPKCSQIFLPNDVHCNVIYNNNNKKAGKKPRCSTTVKWLG